VLDERDVDAERDAHLDTVSRDRVLRPRRARR